MSANTKFETLGDVVQMRGNLRIWCACGRDSVLDAARLERWYRIHRWDTRMHMLIDHLKCGRCGHRPLRIRPTPTSPTMADRFPTDEAGWDRLVKRLRD